MVGALFGFSLSGLRAEDASSTTETRLREALRQTTLQERDLQNQMIELQAAKDQADKDNAGLKAKVETLDIQAAALTKQAAEDKAQAGKAIDDLHAQATDQAAQIARLNQALTEWKNAYRQVAQLATEKEAARAKLALQAALLQRMVDDRETKNLELFQTGSEILVRYEKFGLGDAIGAKEPFVGLSRVKLESLVQGYKDRLLNQTVTPGQALESSPAASPARSTTTSGQESSGKPPAKA